MHTLHPPTAPHRLGRLEKAITDKEKEQAKCREAINTLQKGSAQPAA